MVMNAIDIHQERSVRLSDKASVNRRWTELFRRIEDLPEANRNLNDEENPIIDYVYGHRPEMNPARTRTTTRNDLHP